MSLPNIHGTVIMKIIVTTIIVTPKTTGGILACRFIK